MIFFEFYHKLKKTKTRETSGSVKRKKLEKLAPRVGRFSNF